MFANFCRLLLATFLCFLLLTPASRTTQAKPNFIKSLETLMEIPEIYAVTGSEAHMYVLSKREGLIVYRSTADSLQWLYTSSGLADRGNTLVTDIRFSYLFGKDGRLTVIEPTSVLGVYSSTRLGDDPVDVVRINNDLFLAIDDHGIKKISLETPESVDRPPESVFRHDRTITSLAAASGQLLALDTSHRLFIFEPRDNELVRISDHQMPSNSDRLHTIGNRIYLTSQRGTLYRVRSDGRADELFGIEEPVIKLNRWNNYYVIQGESSRIWIARQGLRPTLFRDDASAGNHFATFKDQLWISEYRQIARWQDTRDLASLDENAARPDRSQQSDTRSDSVDEPLSIASVENRIIPYPRPLLIPLSLESGHDIRDVRFQQKSNIDAIQIRGNSLYWQPSASHVGTHSITVIANSQDGQTDSTSFSVTVRQFNSPPRFSPVRPISIAVNEEFSIPFRANDPDGSDADLIRYIGVDLPDGASLNEQNGTFSWTPSRRQSGEHEFQVIATDQYGAASSLDVKISVVDLSRDGS